MSVPNPTLGKRIPKGKIGDVVFQINPTEITLDDTANWSSTTAPGMANPIQTYGSGNNTTFSFDLYFNARHVNKLQMSVKDYIKTIRGYVNGMEPVLFVYMGICQKVIITECSTVINAMNSKLEPIEATLTLSLSQYVD